MTLYNLKMKWNAITTNLGKKRGKFVDCEEDFIQFSYNIKRNELMKETHYTDDSYCFGVRLTVDLYTLRAVCPTITVRAAQLVSELSNSGPEEYQDVYVIRKDNSVYYSIYIDHDEKVGTIERKKDTLIITMNIWCDDYRIVARKKNGNSVEFSTQQGREICHISSSESTRAKVHYSYLRKFALFCSCVDVYELEKMEVN